MSERSFIIGAGVMGEKDKKAVIMQAALELIVERGFHGAPVSDIVGRAGVAAGTIYQYFENKDVLIRALRDELAENIRQAILEGYPSEKPIRTRFLFFVENLLSYFAKNPLHFRYMEQYFNSPYGISLRRDKAMEKRDSGDIVHELLSEGISKRFMKNLPEVVLFSLALGPMLVIIRDHVLGFITLDDMLIRRITAACWDAVKETQPAAEVP